MRKIAFVTFSFLLLLSIPIGCGDRNRITVGFIGGMSGPTGDLGVEGRKGVLLAVQERNESGGINGRQIELRSYDDRQDIGGVAAAVMDLASVGCKVVIGPFTSEMCLAALPLAEKAEMLIISPTGSSPELSGLDDVFLRTYSSNDAQAELLAEYLYTVVGIRKLALIYDAGNRAFCRPYAEAMQTRFKTEEEPNLTPLAFGVEHPPEFKELVERALQQRPDALFLLTNALDSSLICQQLKKLGSDLPVFGSEWSSSSQLLAYGGSAIEGFTFVQTIDNQSTSPRYREFVSRFRKRFGYDPSFSSCLAYEAAQILFDGVDAAGPTGARQWILDQASFSTLQGTLEFDSFGDCHRDTYLVQLRDGQYHRIAELKK